MSERTVPGWVKALLVGGTFAALVWREQRRPLRKRPVESRFDRRR